MQINNRTTLALFLIILISIISSGCEQVQNKHTKDFLTFELVEKGRARGINNGVYAEYIFINNATKDKRVSLNYGSINMEDMGGSYHLVAAGKKSKLHIFFNQSEGSIKSYFFWAADLEYHKRGAFQYEFPDNFIVERNWNIDSDKPSFHDSDLNYNMLESGILNPFKEPLTFLEIKQDDKIVGRIEIKEIE